MMPARTSSSFAASTPQARYEVPGLYGGPVDHSWHELRDKGMHIEIGVAPGYGVFVYRRLD